MGLFILEITMRKQGQTRRSAPTKENKKTRADT